MSKTITLILLFALILTAVPTTFAAYTPIPNGCGPENGPNVPDFFYFWNWFGRVDVFPFIAACNPHDVCYGTLGTTRAGCDSQFLSNLLTVCAANASTWVSRSYCNGLAYTYYSAVYLFGGWAYAAAQAQAG